MNRRTVVAVVVAVATVASIAVVLWPEPSPVEASLAVVEDDDRFYTALDASDAFAEITEQLRKVDCDVQRTETCARAHRASAWTQVTAILIVNCPPAAVLDARLNLARYLRGRGALPSTPRCGARRQNSSS